MRLIDADALIAEIEDLREPNDPYEHDQYLVGQMYAWDMIEDVVKDAPTVRDGNADEITIHAPNTWRGKVLEKLALDREPVEDYYDVYCPGDLFKGAPQMEGPEPCLANAAGGKNDTTQCDKCWRQCAV